MRVKVRVKLHVNFGLGVLCLPSLTAWIAFRTVSINSTQSLLPMIGERE